MSASPHHDHLSRAARGLVKGVRLVSLASPHSLCLVAATLFDSHSSRDVAFAKRKESGPMCARGGRSSFGVLSRRACVSARRTLSRVGLRKTAVLYTLRSPPRHTLFRVVFRKRHGPVADKAKRRRRDRHTHTHDGDTLRRRRGANGTRRAEIKQHVCLCV